MNVSKYLLFNSHSRPPSFPSPPPLSTTFLCFSLLTCLAHLFFLTLHPQTAQSTSIWLYPFFFSSISSLRSSWYFCHNSLTFSGLFPAHFSLWAGQPLRVALFPLNISNPLCPLPSFFPDVFYPNITTRNSMLCSSQMFSPITFLNTALTHLAINAHAFYTTAIRLNIGGLNWPSNTLIQFIPHLSPPESHQKNLTLLHLTHLHHHIGKRIDTLIS